MCSVTTATPARKTKFTPRRSEGTIGWAAVPGLILSTWVVTFLYSRSGADWRGSGRALKNRH
jgi:hypothetical protein